MSVTHLLQLSQLLASKNYFHFAKLKVEEAIALEPNSAIAYNYLGFILAQTGKLAEAEAAVRSALRLKPDFAEAHNHLGVILGRSGKLALAEASVRSALKLNPNDPQARRNLQVILKHNQDPTNKIIFSTGARSPQTKPPKLNSAQDYNNFSLALLKEGKFGAAEVAARRSDFPQPILKFTILSVLSCLSGARLPKRKPNCAKCSSCSPTALRLLEILAK